jgi:hypothetical protein
MMTLQDALVAYRICVKAEGKSSKTVVWVTSSVNYFSNFLGPEHQDIATISANDVRRFIIALRESPNDVSKEQLEKVLRTCLFSCAARFSVS